MRVALFTDTYIPDVNGVARTLDRWVRYLKTQGIDCKVFAPDSIRHGDPVNRDAVERFYSLPFLLYPECRMALPNPIQLNKLLERFQPTLIHTATPFNMGLVGKRYANKHNIPLIASYHTHFDQYLSCYKLEWMAPLLWRYMKWFHQDCSKILVPSISTKSHLEEKGFSNLEIWPRGVDTNMFYPRDSRENILHSLGAHPDKFTLLYVGRLAPEKSISVLLQAFEQLQPSLKQHMQLLIAGGGPLFKELVEHNTDYTIHYLNFIEGDALASLYAAADVFVFPSATETFGNVVLEAMSSGTAVIGAASGGVKDIIVHQRTGWLCSEGDVSSFANAMKCLYNDDALRYRLSLAGLQYAQKQSWDSIFSSLLMQYRQVQHEKAYDVCSTL